MNQSYAIFISKEKQDHIRRLLSNNSTLNSLASPAMELDANFSQILFKKRKQQNESTIQHNIMESNVLKLDSTVEKIKNRSNTDNTEVEQSTTNGNNSQRFENSMLFGLDKSIRDTSGEDSFLSIERQCNFEDQRQRLIDANDTLLFEVEPPSDLWNQSALTPPILKNLKADEQSFELSPVKCIGLIRPSTIIEETSSQCNSYNNKSDNSVAKSVSTDSIESKENVSLIVSASGKKLGEITLASELKMEKHKRRETFVFKKRNYKFFTDENSESIKKNGRLNEINDNNSTMERNLIDLQPVDEDICNDSISRNQFNDTIEAIDYFMEQGKRLLLEQTPVSKRDEAQQRSVLETPLFSCKRSRMLSEMAAIEMLPISKRGPLLDLSSTPSTDQINSSRVKK